jgi:uncharacterized protein YprB with RNaseH-like and TPR domain
VPTLSDKLKALGVKLGAQELPPPRPRRIAYAIEQVLPGRTQLTPYGEAYLVETLYAPDYRHGHAGLCITASLQAMAEWAREASLLACCPTDLVFLDTETTGLSGGTGTYTFLVGMGRYEGDQFRLVQFFMRDPIEEPAHLAALADFLQPCRALVTFNGKSFDVPLLNTRFVTNGSTSPLGSVAHVDLLHLARRLWRDRLPSRALGYLETHILGAVRTGEDVAGWLIPTLYFDYLRSGDARPLKNVFYHNAMDILALAALFSYTASLLADPLNGGIKHGVDLVAMAKLFEDLGQLETARQVYEHSLGHDLTGEVYASPAAGGHPPAGRESPGSDCPMAGSGRPGPSLCPRGAGQVLRAPAP